MKMIVDRINLYNQQTVQAFMSHLCRCRSFVIHFDIILFHLIYSHNKLTPS